MVMTAGESCVMQSATELSRRGLCGEGFRNRKLSPCRITHVDGQCPNRLIRNTEESCTLTVPAVWMLQGMAAHLVEAGALQPLGYHAELPAAPQYFQRFPVSEWSLGKLYGTHSPPKVPVVGFES